MAKEAKLTERTLTGFLWIITGSGIQVVLKIGVLAVLARLLSPGDFGLVGLAVIVVEFSKMFSHMGVGPAIVQRRELENRHLTTGFTLSLCMGAFFAGILALSAPALATFFNMQDLAPVLRVVALIFLTDSLTLIGQALLQRNMKYKLIASIEVVSYALGYGAVGVTLAYLGWGVWALVTAHLAQAILHAVLVVVVQPFPKQPGFNGTAFRELLYFGGGMTIARIGNFVANQGDNLVIGRMLGAAALGIYGRAYQFMVMPAGLFGSALDKALFPAMAKVQDEKERLGKAYLSGVSMIALVAIPLSVVFVFLAPEIVLVLLGPAWQEVILPFQILACSLLFRMSYKMSDSLARATGAVYKRAWRQLIYAALVITGAYVGQFWGLYGVATGVALVLIVNFLLMAHLSIQLTNIRWRDMARVHVQGILVGGTVTAICAVIVPLTRLHFASNLLTILITGLILGSIFCLLLWFAPGLIVRGQQKELITRLFLKKFKKPTIQAA